MPRFQGCRAPSASERVGSGTTSSGSITRWKPSPWQRSQAPWGELKEKIRGSSSGIEVPQLRQANCSREEQRLGLVVDHLDFDQPGGEAAGGLDRLREPPPQVVLHHQPVDDDGDVVFELLVEDDLLVEPAQLAVDLDPRVALEPHLLQQFPVLAFAPAHDRRHDHEFGPLVEGHQAVDDLLLGLAGDLLAALGAVRNPDPRPEQAQVVVDLGHGADRRARVARGRLLVDRDRRREPLDRVDVGLLHQPEELARVGGERLDVAALALGVDRVEGKARLAGAREPGDDDQRVPRQLEVDVLEVVLAGARDDDAVRGSHSRRVYARRTDVPLRVPHVAAVLCTPMRHKDCRASRGRRRVCGGRRGRWGRRGRGR